MRRQLIALATASALFLSTSLAVAPVSAGSPTEIYVTPVYNILQECYGVFPPPSDRAYWTVELWGGTSGNYQVTVYYGDGDNSTTSHAGSYDTHHDYSCGHGDRSVHWSATRSGGGTGNYYTTVATF